MVRVGRCTRQQQPARRRPPAVSVVVVSAETGLPSQGVERPETVPVTKTDAEPTAGDDRGRGRVVQQQRADAVAVQGPRVGPEHDVPLRGGGAQERGGGGLACLDARRRWLPGVPGYTLAMPRGKKYSVARTSLTIAR